MIAKLKPNRHLTLLAVIAFLLGACQTTPHQESRTGAAHPRTFIVDADIAQLRAQVAPYIEQIRERYKIPGISLVLVRDQQTLWAEGFGFADLENRIPAGPNTIYRAGSLAKPFTAMAVMQLEEEARLDIDQPLNAYLPQFSIKSRFDVTAEPVTIRSILCHHSGLPTDLNKGMWSDAPFNKVASTLSEEYAAFPPNLVFSYSNVGYTLLGHMIEEVVNVPYVDYMDKHLFRPLGMTRSGMRLSAEFESEMARGYRNGKPAERLPIRDLPAYSLHTTAADLGYFMRMLLARGKARDTVLLMPETLEEMLEPQNSDIPLDLNIVNGLGWFLEQNTIPMGGRVIRHGGTTLLYSSELILLPERGLGVAVLANASGSRRVVSKVAEQILRSMLNSGQDAGRLAFQLENLSKDLEPALPTGAGGNYATDLGLISIRPKDAKLCACIIEETFDLIPYPNGWFGVSSDSVDSLPPSYRVLSQLRFKSQMIDGVEVVVAQQGDKQVILGEKIPPTPIPPAWLNRVGKYKLLNPDKDFPLVDAKLMLHEGQLCMSYKLPLLSQSPIRVPLRPISDTEAIILGLGRTRGETLRAVDVGGQERLRYSGFLGKRVSGN